MWAAVAVVGIGSASVTFYGRFWWALRAEIAGSHRRREHHVGPDLRSDRGRQFRRRLGILPGLRPALERRLPMNYLAASIAAVALFAYLVYALLRPERF